MSKEKTLPTGFSSLNNALPSGGWPVGALTELMVAHEGVGEFTLLLPTLAALTKQQQWIALVAPPYIPYAPALINAKVSLDTLLVVDCKDQKDAYWATEQILKSGVFAAVVMWAPQGAEERRQRRLQLAAEQGDAWAVCYRPHRCARTASPAGLRIVTQKVQGELTLEIIKNRGGRLGTVNLGTATDHYGAIPAFHPQTAETNSSRQSTPSQQNNQTNRSKPQPILIQSRKDYCEDTLKDSEKHAEKLIGKDSSKPRAPYIQVKQAPDINISKKQTRFLSLKNKLTDHPMRL